MARRIPPPPSHSSASEGWGAYSLPLSIFLLIAWMLASISVLTSLCSSCFPKLALKRKKKTGKNKQHKQENAEAETEEEEEEGDCPNDEERITELDIAIHGPICPSVEVLAGSTSKRRLSVSMSIGIREGLSKIKTTKKKEKEKAREESLWKKTIILGGKCRFKNDDDEDQEGREDANVVEVEPSSITPQSPPPSESHCQTEPPRPSSSSSSCSSSSSSTDA